MSVPISPESPSSCLDSVALDQVLLELRQRVNPDHFDTWFRGFRFQRSDHETVEFVVPNGFMRDWINAHYLAEIEAALRAVSATTRRLRISVAAADPLGADHGPEPIEPDNGRLAARGENGFEAIGPNVERFVDNVFQNLDDKPAAAANGAVPRPRTQPCPVLNRHYTFEEFVVGPCNQVAHSAAKAIGANPGLAYNPFFVHGNVGLGKTHLLQAICHAVLQLHPLSRVIYISCEEFTNRFIEASQNKTLEAFRTFYRSADVLVIDDVEFLANKKGTQSEFFHTFNALYNANKQIVMSSDRRPPEIPTLEDRLVSRFKWGFETSMEPPSHETRVAIASRKAFVRSVALPIDVANLIAEKVTANIRELEGAVVKVLGLAQLTAKPIDRRLAVDALQGGEFGRPLRVTLGDILGLIATEFSLSPKDLTGKSRVQQVSGPRQTAMYLARAYTEHSLEDIGRFFGNRDHTTILYGVEKVAKRAEQEPPFRALLDKLARKLTGG